MQSLADWIEGQYHHSATYLLRSVSATDIEKGRAPFGQRIRARAGSIVASPVLGAYDPEPDYFFHWFRDSALVIDALRLLMLDGVLDARPHLEQFLSFSERLSTLDGRTTALPPLEQVPAAYRAFVRERAELDEVHGSRVALDTRVNPDGTLDILRWSRPQSDGPALRALALLRWQRSVALGPSGSSLLARLIRADLELLLEVGAQQSFDLWEEESGWHYYTRRVSAAALLEGGPWLARQGAREHAARCESAAHRLLCELDEHWDESQCYYRSRLRVAGGDPRKSLDIAVILATIHAGAASGPHSVQDPRVHATLSALDRLFDRCYLINAGRPPDRGPALGRYEGDVYGAGGAYYFSTLAGAELAYGAAHHRALERRHEEARAWLERGDAYLRTVRRHTPADGSLAEQFDQRSGQPASAKHLAWSYAAYISAVAARKRAVAASR